MVLGSMKKIQSKSPTPIGWVDYLDIWTKSKKSKNCNLDILDSSSNMMRLPLGPWSAMRDSDGLLGRASIKVQKNVTQLYF